MCITVTFLDSCFHGKRDGDTPEWPPSPMRLFQALLAGSRAGCRERGWSNHVAPAFRWLESRKPPAIFAPDAKPCVELKIFVPDNDADKKPNRSDRLSSKLYRPHRLVDLNSPTGQGQSLHYVWPIPDEDWPKAQPYAQVLCREARNLLALGWGIDQAAGMGRVLSNSEVTQLGGRLWRPWCVQGTAQLTWRVPREGTLDDLERCHRSFVNRLGPPYRRRIEPGDFDTVVYRGSASLSVRPCAKFELPEETAFPHSSVCVVAAMLRSLACEHAKVETSHKFPSGGSEVYVAGHVPRKRGPTPPRFSYLALPTIGHPHADGMIRRLLVAEPYGGDGSHARWAERRLRGRMLRDIRGKKQGPLLHAWRRESPRIFGRYTRESEIWSSVTPVVLAGFDDGRHAKAERLLFKAVAEAGIPVSSVVEMRLQKAPFWPGSQYPRAYRRPAYLNHLPAWHVRIVFREPVSGPVAIGAGRHCGLGLLAVEE